MMMLIAADGEQTYTWELTPGVYQLGRSAERDIHVPNVTLSRLHAIVRVSEYGDVTIQNISRRKGTSINGRACGAEPISVHPGDAIYFGEVACQLLNDAHPLPPSPSPVSQPRSSSPVSQALLADMDPEHTVALSIHEALKPLPSRVAEMPELLPTLFEMAKTLTLDNPREEMLTNSLELIERVISADRLAVLFRDENSDSASSEVYTAALRLPSGKDPGAFKISSAIVERIFTEKNAILIGNPKTDPRFAASTSIIQSNITSAIAAPLFDEGDVLGILYLDTTNQLHRYSDEHLRLVSTFGNIIAARLRNQALLEERQQKRLMDVEMERAARVQKRLLRSELIVPDYMAAYAFQEPSRQVGGDLYDVCLLPDGRTVFLVADVSGKGMGAALLMTNILASFRILFERGETELLQNITDISRQLYRSSGPADFATLFAGVIDSSGSEITYLNAGHNPPYLVRKDGSIESLPASGMMIGAFPACAWTETTVAFKPGDTLFIFSDGVTEAETADGAHYGEERLTTFLVNNHEHHPQELTERLLREIQEFVGDAPQSDDITTLTIQRKDV